MRARAGGQRTVLHLVILTLTQETPIPANPVAGTGLGEGGRGCSQGPGIRTGESDPSTAPRRPGPGCFQTGQGFWSLDYSKCPAAAELETSWFPAGRVLSGCAACLPSLTPSGLHLLSGLGICLSDGVCFWLYSCEPKSVCVCVCVCVYGLVF